MTVMVTIHADPVPLAVDEHGVIRVGGTRVPFERIMGYYFQGESAEELAADFPTVGLANVHAAIAYYLHNREDMDAYLTAAREEEERVIAEAERDPRQQAFRRMLDERLAAREPFVPR